MGEFACQDLLLNQNEPTTTRGFNGCCLVVCKYTIVYSKAQRLQNNVPLKQLGSELGCFFFNVRQILVRSKEDESPWRFGPYYKTSRHQTSTFSELYFAVFLLYDVSMSCHCTSCFARPVPSCENVPYIMLPHTIVTCSYYATDMLRKNKRHIREMCDICCTYAKHMSAFV